MTTTYWIGVLLALATVAILLRYRAHHPKRANKYEKTEIMKQLLALSERDTALSAATPGVPSRTAQRQTQRPGKLPPTPGRMSPARTSKPA